MLRPAVIIVVLSLALFAMAQRVIPAEGEPDPSPPVAAPSAGTQASAPSGFTPEETVIERDASGQFHLPARVNGVRTEFVVDTGADLVALTVRDANDLGIGLQPGDFRPIMRTASGTANGARIMLDRLELGDQEYRGVEAVVVEGLEVNLLGQSALRRLGKVELRGDRMVIAHR